MKKIFLFTGIILFAFSSNIFAQPITLSTTNITPTTADLNWDASPCTGNVTLQYKLVSTSSWAGTSIPGVISPYSLTGLTASTNYEWRVKCNGCSGASCWSSVLQFTTASTVFGCTNTAACNFDPLANTDDGSCVLPDGCTNSLACNYDATALCDDGSCLTAYGCTNATACNFDPLATCDDGSCSGLLGCTDNGINTNGAGIVNDIDGDLLAALNYNTAATCDDGSCITIIYGCMDATALNFYASANVDDGSCVYVGPTISNAFISAPILCNGDFFNDSLQIDVNQTAPPTIYTCAVGWYSGSTFIQYTGNNPTFGVQINLNNFQPNVDYYVRIVDSVSYYTANPFGNGTSLVGIYDETGPINFAEPAQLTATTSNTNVSCVSGNDGTATAIPSGGTPFTVGAAYTYLWDDAFAQTTQTATSLSAGTYECTITDSNLCNTIATVIILDPPPLTATATLNLDVSCFGGYDGEVTATPSGGTPFTVGAAYTYLWDDAFAQTTQTATGLLAGTYECTITDSNGCFVLSNSVVVSEPPAITGTTSSTDVSCYGGNDGTATAIPGGGTPFPGGIYNYLWDDPLAQTTQIATSLLAGTYICIITDANGCFLSTSPVVVSQPSGIITGTTSSTDVSCSGDNDGTATVTASGGTPFDPDGIANSGDEYYTYLWSDPLGQTTQTATGLLPGTYTCTVTDATGGCPLTTNSVIILDPPVLVIDSIIVNPITCFGECNASILSIQASGGTPFTSGYSYLYSVNGGLSHPNTSYFNGYCADTYTVEVSDVNNCFNQEILIIGEPLLLEDTITTSLWNNYQIRCNGDNSGFANIVVTGGTTPYTINYYEPGNTTPIPTSSTISGLSAGIYTFEVIDDHGCTNLETITYNEPDTIMHNFIPTHVTCSSWNNGSLTDSVYGGVGNATTYTYLWNNGETTHTINNIGIGEYFIEVRDQNNCLSVDTFDIHDNNALSASVSETDVSCFDYCDGEITVNVVGGIPNINSTGNSIYNYLWNDTLFQTTQTAIGLCVNNNSLSTIYECVVTDMQGCAITLSGTIEQPTQVSVTASIVEEILCFNGSNGQLNSFGSGGVTPYHYLWNDNTNTAANNGVPAGNYVITLTDTRGCTAADFITLNEPTELSLTISDTSVTCFGFNDGIIVAAAGGGTPFLGIPPEYLYTVINETGASVYSETIPVGLAENLLPGIYTIIAEDMNGCTIESGTIYISEPGDSLSITFNTVDASCLQNNGSASIEAYGGTPLYQYNWDNNVTTANNTSLEAGYYPVTVIDSRGCEIRDSAFVKGTHNVFADSLSEITFNICLGDSVFITVNETPLNTYVWENGSTITDRWVYPTDYINIYTLTITDLICPSAYEVVATVNVDFIDPMPASNPGVEYGNFPVVLAGDNINLYSENNTCVEYTWEWTNETISNNNGLIIIEELQKTDWYYLYVKDSEGCLGYDSIYVVVGVKPYDAITPNNDGFNDTWTPLDIESYENALVQVFNRWGGLVFESKGGENYQAWDGTNGGKELAVGTYYYIIDLDTGDEPQTGPITIVR